MIAPASPEDFYRACVEAEKRYRAAHERYVRHRRWNLILGGALAAWGLAQLVNFLATGKWFYLTVAVVYLGCAALDFWNWRRMR